MNKMRMYLLLLAVLAAFALSSCGGNTGGGSEAIQKAQTQDAETLEENGPVEVRTAEDLAQLVDHVEQWMDGNNVTVQVYLLPEWEDQIELAWYLMQDGEPLIKDWYQPETLHTFSGLEPGAYRIKYYLRYGELTKSFYAEDVTIGLPDTENEEIPESEENTESTKSGNAEASESGNVEASESGNVENMEPAAAP